MNEATAPIDLSAFLDALGIVAPRHEHAPVMTVAESERLVPSLPGAKTKNLFLRDAKGARYFLVMVPHDSMVDLRALGDAIGAGRLGFASPERLWKHLRVTPGSVSVLALCNDVTRTVEFVIDRALWQAPALQAHPLTNNATMIVAHADLERFLRATGHPPRIVETPQSRAPEPPPPPT